MTRGDRWALRWALAGLGLSLFAMAALVVHVERLRSALSRRQAELAAELADCPAREVLGRSERSQRQLEVTIEVIQELHKPRGDEALVFEFLASFAAVGLEIEAAEAERQHLAVRVRVPKGRQLPVAAQRLPWRQAPGRPGVHELEVAYAELRDGVSR